MLASLAYLKEEKMHEPLFLLYTLFEDSDLNAYPLPMRLPLLPACLELLFTFLSESSLLISNILIRLKGGDIFHKSQSQFFIEFKEDCANERDRRAV